ncbi:death domain-associated protein 6 [Anolis carolinensis]|uniref:death domain-associated protein 6 n=1 Tax=Anolis carolinensis TaxID=28377 RepID=UPI002F2B6E7B
MAQANDSAVTIASIPSSSSDSSCLILDDDEEEEEERERRQPGAGEASKKGPDAPEKKPEERPAPHANGRAPSAAHTGLRAENERLFAEFVAFCTQHTADHPEVMPYLAARHQKAEGPFLASVEFRNILGRCLSRVQSRRSKVYVYINELCAVFKNHSQRRRVPITTEGAPPEGPSAPPEEGPAPEAPPAEPPKAPPPSSSSSSSSRRQIRYLENLLRLYAEEIRRLQERELNLEELDEEDSAYLQEGRLKRRMMLVFRRLCALKDCNGLTGRVIEQRIPYRGTRYPEVNRRIERLINRQTEAFPDYADILKAVQKASARHSLGLPKKQMQSMAADAFREVGNRLQERRHLDLIYNFGSHLTDQYRPGTDPALTDKALALRLRQNRERAVQRLEEVTSQFAQLQDQSEEQEWRRRRKGGRAPTPTHPGPSAHKETTPQKGSQSPKQGSKGSPREEEEEEEEEDEEEEEEEDSSLEWDMEEDLAKCLEGEEDEEEEEGPPPDEEPPAQEVEADQRMDLEVVEVMSSSAEDEEEDEEDEEEEDEEESDARSSQGAGGAEEGQPGALEAPLAPQAGKPRLPEKRETPPPSPILSDRAASKRKGGLQENGGSPQAGLTSIQGLNGQPPGKRARTERRGSNSSCIEVPSTGSSEAEEEEGGHDADAEVVLFRPLPPAAPPQPDSTCADSPGQGLVSSSLGSPPRQQTTKTSVATQCDPEEVIVLSDSD